MFTVRDIVHAPMIDWPECRRDSARMKFRIKELLEKQGMRQTQLADAVDVNRSFISDIVNNKKRPSEATLLQIAHVLGVDVGALYESSRPVPVVGRIGAGAAVDLVDAFAKGDGDYFVACPDDLPMAKIVAVEVVGDSMEPIILPGDILFFTRNFMGLDDAALGRVAICQTEDGRALVKLIKAGRDAGTFDLHSANNTAATEYGVRLKWAAPLRRHLSKEDIERVAR